MNRNTQRRMQQQAQQRQASFTPSQKAVGKHLDCGGDVLFVAHESDFKFHYCDTCQMSTREGATLQLEE